MAENWVLTATGWQEILPIFVLALGFQGQELTVPGYQRVSFSGAEYGRVEVELPRFGENCTVDEIWVFDSNEKEQIRVRTDPLRVCVGDQLTVQVVR